MELVIKIDAAGAEVRAEQKEFEGRKYTERYQVGRMAIDTPDGVMEAPVRIPLYRDEVGYSPGEYGVSSMSFDRKRNGKLDFVRLHLAERKRAAAANPKAA